ncbi:MAG: OmpA family protein [Muribaculaceae bacterium]|nr:OmpA family protein [Muribaculaceae bacterium]
MKAKNLYIAAALCAGTFGASNVAYAQDVFVDDAVTVTEFTCDNSTHYFTPKNSNWFIELGAGAGQPLVEKGTEKTVDGKKWTAAYSVGFGRWFSPYLGFRIKAIGGAVHWNAVNWDKKADWAYGWSRAKHVNLQAELMWDMFNSFGGVNEKRVFSIVPFVGLGGDAMWDYKNHYGNQPAATNNYTHGRAKSVQWTLPVSAGLQFRFRLSKYVDFFAEARAAFYGDNWNNVSEGNSVDAYVSAMGGFSFNLGGRGWNSFNECNYVSQIASLNGQVNNLRAQLDACGATVAALQAQLPCPEVVAKDCNNAPLMASVRFLINSAKIMPTEEVNVYSMAEWLKANPNEKIVIAGYADKDTGTSEYNMDLSQRRADAVKAELVNTYGIDPSRLETKAFGSDEQEYPSHNDWNRIVIFKQ